MNYKIRNKNSGFSLVELMVATSIFMIIMLVAIGSLVVSSSSAKKARALRTAMDNVNFAMESMTRSLRTASDYACITTETFSLPIAGNDVANCTGLQGGNGVAFTPAENYLLCHNDPTNPKFENENECRTTAYALVPRDGGDTFVLKKFTSTDVDGKGVSMVADNVDIKDLRFYVEGTLPDEPMQPKIYLVLRGTVNIGDEPNDFALQTLISQRLAK